MKKIIITFEEDDNEIFTSEYYLPKEIESIKEASLKIDFAKDKDELFVTRVNLNVIGEYEKEIKFNF